LNYLRFTPTEYRTLSAVCHRLDLGTHSLPAFRRLLAVALAEASPKLARRVSRLRPGEAELLYRHFQPRPAAAVRHDLTDEELSAFAQACGAASIPVRFVRPFQGTLVETVEELLPELAAKVARMSGYAFERLYNKALGREWWSA
jgi:hypothetical protein